MHLALHAKGEQKSRNRNQGHQTSPQCLGLVSLLNLDARKTNNVLLNKNEGQI